MRIYPLGLAHVTLDISQYCVFGISLLLVNEKNDCSTLKQHLVNLEACWVKKAKKKKKKILSLVLMKYCIFILFFPLKLTIMVHSHAVYKTAFLAKRCVGLCSETTAVCYRSHLDHAELFYIISILALLFPSWFCWHLQKTILEENPFNKLQSRKRINSLLSLHACSFSLPVALQLEKAWRLELKNRCVLSEYDLGK